MAQLHGTTIAILATDGVEQVELTEPRRILEEAGAKTVLLAPQDGEIQGFDHLDHADRLAVDGTVADARPEDFDGVLLPGGVANGDTLRADEDAVGFVAAVARAGKPVASICHAQWILIDAGLAEGRTLTSYPSLRTDLRNAGARWVDEEVVVDRGVVTSRNPGDIPAFSAAAVAELAKVAQAA